MEIKKFLPRRTYSWTDGALIDKCYKCSLEFTLYYRQHHCRGCGRIFCHKCSESYVDVSSLDSANLINLDTFIYDSCYTKKIHIDKRTTIGKKMNPEYTPVRVCVDCSDIYKNVRECSKILTILKLLPISIKDIYELRCLNKMWYKACNMYISQIREIQYYLPKTNLSAFESQFLRNNISIIERHNGLYTKYLTTTNTTISNSSRKGNTHDNCTLKKKTLEELKALKTKRHLECKMLLCDHNCVENLTNENLLELIVCGHDCDITFPDSLIDGIYTPILAYSLKYNLITFNDFILKHCIYDSTFQQTIFWELIGYTQETGNRINRTESENYTSIFNVLINCIKTYSDDIGIFVKIKHLIEFINTINNETFINSGNRLFPDASLESPPLPPLPRNQENLGSLLPLDIAKIYYDKITVIQSQTKPIFIPYLDSLGNKHSILFKFDDVRKDYIINSIIKCMNKILIKHGYDMEIVTYDILPIDKSRGIIQIVENAETIETIKNKYKGSILNYILHHNPNTPVGILRTRFIKSTAFYCILTYLLGVGDRHLDNIMVTHDGRLFHIDFSYIFGIDCKPLAPQIKIVQEMIDVMGGVDTEYYESFKDYCIEIYNILRMHVNVFACFFNLFDKTTNNIDIEKRFLLGEYSEQANIQMSKIIELNKNKTSSSISDLIHHYYKIW